ncbi:MAG: translocation/assembly module TamB domain-containing protein [Deltaproteobacteria bacterium]|nr:translocation/assembly module TamB domain-containing protein [Deltaproteobacteria bacterium]
MSKKRIFLLLAVLLAVVCLLASLPSLGKLVVEQAGARLGLALRVGGIGGNLVNHLTLARLEGVRRDDTQPRVEFSAVDVRLDYSLLTLLNGLDTFLAHLKIEAAQARLAVDIPAPPDSSTDAATGETVILPAVLPVFSVNDVDLEIRQGDYTVAVTDASLHIGPLDVRSGQPVRINIPGVWLEVKGQKKLETSCQLTMRYTADALHIDELTTPDKLAAVQGSVVWGRGGQPPGFTLRADLGGGRLRGSGTLAPGATSLEIKLEDLDVAELARLLHFVDFPVAGKLSGNLASRITPGETGLPPVDMELELSAGKVRGEKTEVRLQGGIKNDTLMLSALSGNFGANEVDLAEVSLPLAFFAARDWSGLGNTHIGSFRLRLRNIPAILTALGQEPLKQSVPAHVFEIQGNMGEQVLKIARGDLRAGSNSALLTKAELKIPAPGQSWLDASLSGGLQLDLADLQAASALLNLPEMAGTLEGSAGITGSLRKPVGDIALQAKELAYGRCVVGEARIKGQSDSARLKVESLLLQNGSDTLTARGVYALADNKIVDIEGQLSIHELAGYAETCPGLPTPLAGRVEASVATLATGEQQLHVSLHDGSVAGYGLAAMTAEFTTDWRNFTVAQAMLDTDQGKAVFSGLAHHEQAGKLIRMNFDQLVLSRKNSSFSLTQPVSAVFTYGDNPALDMDEAVLRGEQGTIAMQGRLDLHGESSFQAESANLSSRGWLDGLIGPGYHFSGADLALTVEGPLVAPRGTLSGAVAELKCPQPSVPFGAALALGYSPAGLKVEKLLLATANGEKISLEGMLPYDPLRENPFLPDPLSVKGYIELPAPRADGAGDGPGQAAKGELRNEFVLDGAWEQPAGRFRVKGANLTLAQFIKHGPDEPVAIDCDLRLNAGKLVAREFSLSSPSFTLRAKGAWSGIPSLAELAARLPDQLPGKVDLEAQLHMPETGWLAPYLGGVRRLSGVMDVTLKAEGAAARPLLTGDMKFAGGSIGLENPGYPSLEKLELRADLERDVITLRKFTGSFGGAPFQATGDVTLQGADGPYVNCQIIGNNFLFYRDESMKIRADADLLLKGNLSKPALTGKINITDGGYRKNIDFLSLFKGSGKPRSEPGLQLFSLDKSPWRDMSFEVRISSEEPFVIANNMAKGAVRPTLLLTGTGNLPVLTGRIFVDPTRINVPAGRISVESGVIQFPENDPGRVTFDMTARSRLAGYDITMIFQGTPDEPAITLSSDPPLPEEDLLLLVLTGQPPVSTKEGGRRVMANMNTAVYLGQGLLANWFGGGEAESEETVLDRFEFDFGRKLTKTGQETVEAQFRLIEGFFLAGDRLYLTSEKDVYDNLNFGVKIVFRFR